MLNLFSGLQENNAKKCNKILYEINDLIKEVKTIKTSMNQSEDYQETTNFLELPLKSKKDIEAFDKKLANNEYKIAVVCNLNAKFINH